MDQGQNKAKEKAQMTKLLSSAKFFAVWLDHILLQNNLVLCLYNILRVYYVYFLIDSGLDTVGDTWQILSTHRSLTEDYQWYDMYTAFMLLLFMILEHEIFRIVCIA